MAATSIFTVIEVFKVDRIGSLPEGHAGAALTGCVSRPTLRFDRRSLVHRPSLGAPERCGWPPRRTHRVFMRDGMGKEDLPSRWVVGTRHSRPMRDGRPMLAEVERESIDRLIKAIAA